MRRREIEDLWQEHVGVPLPFSIEDYQDDEIFDLVTVDTGAAGCIQTFLSRNPPGLDPERIAVLERCAASMQQSLGWLSGEQRSYFQRLHKLSVLVLQASSGS